MNTRQAEKGHPTGDALWRWKKREAASSRPKGCHQTWLAGKNGGFNGKIMGKYEENQHNWRFYSWENQGTNCWGMFQRAMFDDTAGNLIRHPEVDRIWNFEHFPISVYKGFLKFPHSVYSRMTIHIYIVLYLCLCPYLYLYLYISQPPTKNRKVQSY